MNIQDVIANLLATIERKEQYLKTLSPTDKTMAGILKFNLQELREILNDCMAAREADILKDLEIKRLERLNSNYTWQLYSKEQKT